MAGQYPGAVYGVPRASTVAGERASASSSGRRELTSQYGAGSAGSVISTRTARLR